MNKKFPWKRLREWIKKYGFTKRQVGLKDIELKGRPSSDEADAVFAKIKTLILEDSPEYKELLVIEGTYRCGGRWEFMRQAMEKRHEDDLS